jgi:prolyl-tRNA editing enzyme YbaK/EbsC (Cys-tRNA(Pro) deacylase)
LHRGQPRQPQEDRAATGLKLGKADAALVKERVGYAIVVIPPAGHLEPLETLIDLDLMRTR